MICSEWMNIVIIAIIVTTIIVTSRISANESAISLPGCRDKCGDVSIPYPFGIGMKCYLHSTFKVYCNKTFDPPKPIYGDNVEVLDINFVDAQIRMPNYIARQCYNTTSGRLISQFTAWMNLPKFTINTTLNIFAATGCDTFAKFTGDRSKNRTYTTGCLTQCTYPDDIDNGTCAGVGCCETRIPEDVYYISVEAGSLSNYTNTTSTKYFQPCGSAFVVARDSFNFTMANLTTKPENLPDMLPVVYDWSIGNRTCAVAQARGTCLCCHDRGSVECLDSILEGYRCSCLPGFSGNPYLPNGCQDIDECSPGPGEPYCKEPATCSNTHGSYNCLCPKGFHGNGTTSDHCVRNNHQIAIILSVGGSVIFVLVLGLLLHWRHGKKKIQKMQDNFFRQNGGMILLHKLSRRDSSTDSIKIFTVEDLKKATNNYNGENIIGRGGFGIVYKGILLTTGQVVAIKKSIKIDSSQKEQFINELLLLSKLNNKNVVKLIGCCLEDEVPLLVYEFISNGTLHEHLHDEKKASLLSWNIRLSIATEVAEVLAYLHTTIHTPIIHRDMKPANILLDENYVAKVSDFGASRILVPTDQAQEATMVQGTRGYLDPEYMQTGELNDKSDVYSFGVVLVQLLTGRKVISYTGPENEKFLAMHFLSKCKEKRVLEIIDEKIKCQLGATEQFEEVAILARRCLEVKGQDRPTMKDVSMELERIRRKNVHQLLSTNVGLFEDEGQHLLSRNPMDLSISADDDDDTFYLTAGR